MSAKDNILHAMKWTVKDEFNHKMEVSNAVDGCVIFYPHNDMVQISYEDLEKLIENLKKPNSNYIRKNSREEDPEINSKEFKLQKFAYNYNAELVKKDNKYVGIHIPADRVVTKDDLADLLEMIGIEFVDIFNASVGTGFDVTLL